MLNVSSNSIQKRISQDKIKALDNLNLSSANKMFTRWLWGTMIFVVILCFLPWTQNIQSKGKVTTLNPDHRPQTIHSTIAGRVEKWYVQEGQLVEKGDTILFLSEIKAEYFDTQLVDRTNDQVRAKEEAVVAYGNKAKALNDQMANIREELILKRAQLKNKITQGQLKITSDSIAAIQADIDYQIAVRQFIREDTLYKQGIKTLTQLEGKRLKMQETQAKQVAAFNKLATSSNEMENAMLQLNQIEYEYGQKLAKATSDRFSTLSQQFDTEANVNKLRIASSNYARRADFYYIIAPQDAYITKAIVNGIGETVKEGEAVVSIMPAKFNLAVEMFVTPMDLPLLQLGETVRIQFDGWPAIVFAGWPDVSFGTFTGKVVAIDNMITTKDSKYRVLVSPDDSEKEWPKALRPGSGAWAITLLNDVPIWYEVWRQLNGFPPDYYYQEEMEEDMPKLKAPLKSVK